MSNFFLQNETKNPKNNCVEKHFYSIILMNEIYIENKMDYAKRLLTLVFI